jgi:nucleoside-diphosphate-sugar epimerase
MAQARTALVVGGTGQIGPVIAHALDGEGWRVTLVNRGRSATPPIVSHLPRIVADRSEPDALVRALAGSRWDLVVDCTCFTGAQAADAMRAFAGSAGQYIVLSTGQVFLVGRDAPMPSRDGDERTALIEAPEHTWHREQWQYGVDKRDVESLVRGATGMHTTVIRLPMVHSPADPYQRLHQYLWRALDGRGLVLPDEPDRALRHVGVDDIARAVADLSTRPMASGTAVQLAPEHSESLAWFLGALEASAERGVPIHRVSRSVLDEAMLWPRTSPFSTGWMSVLDGSVLAAHLGWWPRPVRTLLSATLAAVRPGAAAPPAQADQRDRELTLVRSA